MCVHCTNIILKKNYERRNVHISDEVDRFNAQCLAFNVVATMQI